MNTFIHVLEMYETEPFPDSSDIFAGMTYRWLNSIINLNLFRYYKNIDIPLLFLHGELDSFSAVESTRYIENNLPNMLFTFIYYPDMGHNPLRGEQSYRFQRDIREWLIEIDP
jgi:pimeloyl-ACP methyl ester carboxylesterase